MYTWGCNDEGALGRVTSSNDGEEFTAGPVQDIETVNIVMVSAGDSHTMALSDKGTVFGWGTYRVCKFSSKNRSAMCTCGSFFEQIIQKVQQGAQKY